MDRQKVHAAPADGAPRTVPVPAEFRDVLTQAATALIGARAHDAYEGIGDGVTPPATVDLLVRVLVQAIDARAEIVAAAGRPDGACRLAVIEQVGPAAIERERERIAGMWEEHSDDYVALSEYTSRLSELERLVILAGSQS